MRQSFLLRSELIAKITEAIMHHADTCRVCLALQEIINCEMKIKNEKKGGHKSYSSTRNVTKANILISLL